MKNRKVGLAEKLKNYQALLYESLDINYLLWRVFWWFRADWRLLWEQNFYKHKYQLLDLKLKHIHKHGIDYAFNKLKDNEQ